MIFKAEEPKDFNEVARITYAAFLSWRNDDLHIHEPDMVALARQSSMYDRELSIVAKENSKIIGHVLLMPSDFVVLGKSVKGVILGPVSVDPDFQRQGIGAKLIEYAHQQAMSKGYEFSLLCGHPAYYPKLGYLQNVFSFSGTKIEKITDTESSNNIASRPLIASDIDIIDKWQSDLRRDEPLAILFEKDIMGYHAFSKEKSGQVLEIDSIPAAYVKYKTYSKEKIDYIFYDRAKLMPVIEYLIAEREGAALEISQPYKLFKEILPKVIYKVEDVRKTNEAFMIKPFYDAGIINEYCKRVAGEADLPGVISFPPYCDVG